MVVHRVDLDRLLVHVEVPHLDGHKVAGDNVTPVVRKLEVRDQLQQIVEEGQLIGPESLRVLENCVGGNRN